MEVKFKVCVGASAGNELRISGPKFFIGRAEDCHLRPKSELISRHHCVVVIEDTSVLVRDLGSRNGTLVNGERVLGERELQQGDHLKVGPLEFEVLIAQTSIEPKGKLPKVTSIKEAAARTAAGRGDHPDVEEWLGTETPTISESRPPAQEVLAEAETREIESTETEEINLAATLIDLPPQKPVAIPKERPDLAYKPDLPEQPAEGGNQPQKTEAGKTDPGKPGKLPFRPRSADSRQAANDVLKKFFNRR
jgi:pSer/pThr/pTyr-binding forkhead associated (FHA) protein